MKRKAHHNQPFSRTYTVQQPSELLPFLLTAHAEKSRSAVKSLLAHRQVAVNGRCTTAFDSQLQTGDVVRISAVGEERPNPNHKCRIVYEDSAILVVDKKNGVLSMSTGKENETTVFSLMMQHVRRHHPNDRVFIVHRLDRDTSGLLLLAKNELAQARLQYNWNENIIKRSYVAVVEGSPAQDKGQIVSWLTENHTSFKMHSSPVDNGGKKAVTSYRVLHRGRHYSLLELDLETGRKNQIRIHMATLGHPIAGDRKYGAQTNPLHRVCLHARTLTFKHPITYETMSFDSGIPPKFR
jgi:23S rRNA pseudouridine1911/1915/1917 synthase